MPVPIWLRLAGAGDHARKRHRVAAVEGQRAVVGDVADDAAGRAAIAELQGAGADGGAARIGVVASQDGRAGADLADAAGARDHARKRVRVAAIEGKHATIRDVADDTAGGPTIAELQGPGADRGAARISVVAGQRQAAGPGLGECAGAR